MPTVDALQLVIGGVTRDDVPVALFQNLPGSLLHDVLNSRYVRCDRQGLSIPLDWMTEEKMDLLLETYETGKAAACSSMDDSEFDQFFSFFQIPESAWPAVYKWRYKSRGKVEERAVRIRDCIVSQLDKHPAGMYDINGYLGLDLTGNVIFEHPASANGTKTLTAPWAKQVCISAVLTAATQLLKLEGFVNPFLLKNASGSVHIRASLQPAKKAKLARADVSDDEESEEESDGEGALGEQILLDEDDEGVDDGGWESGSVNSGPDVSDDEDDDSDDAGGEDEGEDNDDSDEELEEPAARKAKSAPAKAPAKRK